MSDNASNAVLAECLFKYSQYLKENQLSGSLPVTSLDYSSLYPSLIMAYNLSPEFLITDEQRANELRSKYPIHDIDFTYNFETFTGEKRSRQVRAWTVRHDESLRENTRFGLYPTILKDLFAQRKQMKVGLAKHKKTKERLEDALTKEELDASDEYKECLFGLKYSDTKQKALKVYMNTFYGELGNKNSPLFILALAGGITSSGQDNLKRVKKFIEEGGCRVYYGDTDSLYFSMDNRLYYDIHRAYFCEHQDKQRYSTEMVEFTFTSIDTLNKAVNDFLFHNNGTRYLNMAYEEVLYPVAFLARKKYYGIAHEGIVNFRPQSMFIRGFEVKKRGVSAILCILCNAIMWDSMSLDCCQTLRHLVETKVDYMFTRKWEIEDFVATALWKPEKQNVPLATFASRMKAEGKREVVPYERFSYVLCKITSPDRLFDLQGRKIKVSKGDMMEYLDYAKENDLEIDIAHYFKNQLAGQFARLISYDADFVVDTSGEYVDMCGDTKYVDVDDDKTMARSRAYVVDIASKYMKCMDSYAQSYKNIFRAVRDEWGKRQREIAVSSIRERNPVSSKTLFSADAHSDNVVDSLNARLADYANANISKWKTIAKDTVKQMRRQGLNVFKLYHNTKRQQGQEVVSHFGKLKHHMDQERGKLMMDIVVDIRKSGIGGMVCAAEDTHVEQLVRKYRTQLLDDTYTREIPIDKLSKEQIAKGIDTSEIEVDQDAIDRVHRKYTKLLAIYAAMHQQQLIHDLIYNL